MSAKSLADNGWLTLISRVAVMVVAAALIGAGKLLWDLNTSVTKITTIQQQVLVPGLVDVKGGLKILTDNLLNQPRFDKGDGLRLDRDHRTIMDEQDKDHSTRMDALDARIRDLEAGGGWKE
jgi:hypothetical protein